MSVKLKNASGVSPLHQVGQSREDSATVAAPKARMRLAKGNGRSAAALGPQSQSTSSPKGAKDGEVLALGEIVQPRRWKASPGDHPDLHYIGLEHIEAHTTRLLGSVPATEMRSTANRFQSGDVLYSRLRPYLNKVWRADREGLCSSEFIVLPGNDRVDSAYLRYRLNAHDFVSFANSLNAGDRPWVDFDQIATFKTWLPCSLPEQRRIVAEIEKQFTRLEAGVAALRRVQANLKRYRAAVLKAACEGRLVPTEAELAKTGNRKARFESGETLLARILTERRKNWKGRGQYKEPVEPDTANFPTLPDGWAWASAEQLCLTVASGSTPSADQLFQRDGEVPFIKVYNLTFGGPLDFSVKPTFISKVMHEGRLGRSKAFPGDVLTNIVGPPLGKVSIVPDRFPEWNINQAIVVFRPTEAISNRLLAFWLRSEGVLARLDHTAKATAGQFNIQVTTCRKLALPVPPMAEQTRITAEVERRMSVVDELEVVVSANLKRAIRLRESILQKAFTGQLLLKGDA